VHRLAIGAAALVLIVSAAIYTTALDQSPPYLMHDELQFSLQARSIAASGHDLAGRRLPVYFTEPEFPAGRDPVIIYYTAGWLRVLPFSQAHVKLPTAVLGVVNIALMFALGWLLFGGPWGGVLAAALLAFTPIHFIRARLVLSPFHAVPFVLGWLIALCQYVRTGSRRALIAGAACVTLSVYSYLACMVMAPVYLLITLVVAAAREGRKVVLPLVVTSAVLLLPLVIWSLTHPERYGQLIDAYHLYGSGNSGSPVAVPALAPGTPTGPRLWLGLVWQFFNPDFLFISGDSSLINSTRSTGLFPIAFAVLIPFGVWAAIKSRQTMARVVVAGLFTAPLASILSGAIEMNRIMFVIPFAVLCAAWGAEALWRRQSVHRALAVLLLGGVAWQFAGFHHHYLTAYPAQAGKWFGENIRDAIVAVISDLPRGPDVPPIEISGKIPFAARYWQFYAAVLDRSELDARPGYPREVPASDAVATHVICRPTDADCARLRGSGTWQRLDTSTNPDGSDAFDVFVRVSTP